MEVKLDKKFTKILVAKYSPPNGCNINEGEVLILRPKKNIPMKNYVPHYFISMESPSLKSKYGWVKDVEPFAFKEFIKRHVGSEDLSDDERSHLYTMLQAIEKLPAGTPVATEYSKYGVIEQKMVITVHKVIFYKEK